MKHGLIITVFLLLAFCHFTIGCGEEVDPPITDEGGDTGGTNEFGTEGSVSKEEFAQAQDDYADSLALYVNEDLGLVDYAGFLADRDALDDYVTAAGGVTFDDYRYASELSAGQRLAFWINAYNALTLQLILDNYPLSSITDLDGGQVWDKHTFNVGGTGLTLNNIEHDIIRADFDEPRIHFAVNCASISCPRLTSQPYSGDASQLEQELEAAAALFANNDDLHVKIDQDEGSVAFTVLVRDWYAGDFGGLDGVVDFIAARLDDADSAQYLLLFPRDQIESISYDWSLNDWQ